MNAQTAARNGCCGKRLIRASAAERFAAAFLRTRSGFAPSYPSTAASARCSIRAYCRRGPPA